jgi:hypothetical protein
VVVVDLTDPLFPSEGIRFSAGNGIQPHRVFVETDRLWTSRSRSHSLFGLQNPPIPTLLIELTLSDDTEPIDAVAAIPGAVHVSAGNTIQTFLVEEPFALQEVAYHTRSTTSGSPRA